jgi:hypothetical protein
MAVGYFGQNFLQGFQDGFFEGPGLKDYQHASLTYRSNGYELAPRNKFLYHVYFNINTGQIPQLQAAYGSGEIASISLMVKSIDLPSYQMNVETMNQYNRKRLVQTKINYQPVNLVFHDDQGDLIRNMWYNYYSYYYKDPSQTYDNVPAYNGSIGNLNTLFNGFGYNTRDTYSSNRQVNDWGYVGESYSDGTASQTAGSSTSGKPPFFRDIRIYGLSQKKFAAYVLINPMITSWKHDQYAYAEGAGTMTNNVELQYETVKYYSGAIGGATPSNTVPGFADPAHYDLTRSGLARPGSTQTVFGQGGLIDAGAGIIEDLNAIASGQGGLNSIIGAAQKAGTAYNTFKGKSIASIANQDAKQAIQNIAQYSLPGYTRQAMNSVNGMIFPTPPRAPATQLPVGQLGGPLGNGQY